MLREDAAHWHDGNHQAGGEEVGHRGHRRQRVEPIFPGLRLGRVRDVAAHLRAGRPRDSPAPTATQRLKLKDLLHVSELTLSGAGDDDDRIKIEDFVRQLIRIHEPFRVLKDWDVAHA